MTIALIIYFLIGLLTTYLNFKELNKKDKFNSGSFIRDAVVLLVLAVVITTIWPLMLFKR